MLMRKTLPFVIYIELGCMTFFFTLKIFFFIHMFQVNGIVDQIVKFGKVTRPILGIKFAPDQSVEQLGVSGVLVLDAPANGPAGKAVCMIIFLTNLTFICYKTNIIFY